MRLTAENREYWIVHFLSLKTPLIRSHGPGTPPKSKSELTKELHIANRNPSLVATTLGAKL
jgi:hypothetical protein